MLKKCKCGYWYETTWQDLKKSWYVYNRNKRNKGVTFKEAEHIAGFVSNTHSQFGGDTGVDADNADKAGNNTCKAQTKKVVDSN